MRILHPKTDTRKTLPPLGHVADSPKSMVPNDRRGINSIMVGINGRSDRRYYGPATRGFWRPPPAVQEALKRGNRKCRAAS